MKILSFLFGKRKDGKCRFWEHEYEESVKNSFLADTGQYLGGESIKQKYYYQSRKCKNCGKTDMGDISVIEY